MSKVLDMAKSIREAVGKEEVAPKISEARMKELDALAEKLYVIADIKAKKSMTEAEKKFIEEAEKTVLTVEEREIVLKKYKAL